MNRAVIEPFAPAQFDLAVRGPGWTGRPQHSKTGNKMLHSDKRIQLNQGMQYDKTTQNFKKQQFLASFRQDFSYSYKQIDG